MCAMKKPYYVVPRSAADVDNLDAVSALFALNDVMEETARDAVGRIMQVCSITTPERLESRQPRSSALSLPPAIFHRRNWRFTKRS